MTPSSDLIRELRAARPAAPPALRARVRELAARAEREPRRRLRGRLRLPARRAALVAVPAAAALALVSAGVLGALRPGGPAATLKRGAPASEEATRVPAPDAGAPVLPTAVGPAGGRAQRVSAWLTVEVPSSDAVSRSAQRALELARRLGGHVVSASVATGEEGSATVTLRVPAGRVQDAIVELSALGRLVSQQVSIDDLQAELDALASRRRSLRAQVARLDARLRSPALDDERRALLETRLRTLRAELNEVGRDLAATRAEARWATVQAMVATPGALGAVPPAPSRLDRTLDEALRILAWEGLVALGALLVAAPALLLALSVWAARQVRRRRAEELLLSPS